VQVEIAPECLQLTQEPDQVLKAAAKAIDGPSSDHVDLARGRVFEQAIEARPLVAPLGTRNAGILVTPTTCQPERAATASSSLNGRRHAAKIGIAARLSSPQPLPS